MGRRRRLQRRKRRIWTEAVLKRGRPLSSSKMVIAFLK
jgi:hypothetical protein